MMFKLKRLTFNAGLLLIGTVLLYPHIFESSDSNRGDLLTNTPAFNPSQGCTTILVGKDATGDGSVMLGHNEDMGTVSGRLKYHPRQTHEEKEVHVNYVTIPQVPETVPYWASGNSQPVAEKHYDGGWILCGINGFGVSFGCNTMSTREERIPRGKGIMRYSIRQLILERSKSAREAVDLIGRLIDTYGQSGSPVAYCIADVNEAWLVETTYRHWVALRIPDDRFHVISNQYTIETKWDLASDGLIEYAVTQGWYDPASGPFNFKTIYNDQDNLDRPNNTSREFQGDTMLRDKMGSITVKDILAVLSQPPIQTTATQAFMVWHLRKNIPLEIGCVMWHGMCGANTSVAVPVFVGSTRVPEEFTSASYREDDESAWWQFERLQKRAYPRWWEYTVEYFDVREKLNTFQETVFKERATVEEKALRLWKQGDMNTAKELLTNFTYEKLEDALKVVKNTLSLSGEEQRP